MSQNVLVEKYGLTPQILQLREIFKKSYWLTAYILCGYNETNVKKFPEDSGFDLCMNQRLQGSICNIVQYRDWIRFIMLLPRGFLKTSLLSAYRIWRIINNPNIRICIIPNNETNGKSFIATDQETLQSPLFTATFPEIMDGVVKSQRGSRFSTVQYTVNRDDPPPMGEPTVCLKTLQQKKPSQHYDEVLLDDPVDDVNSRTVTERERVKYAIRNIVPLLDNPRTGRIWDVGTRWHFDDAHGELLQNPDYMKLVMSITDENGQPTFPEKYPLSVIPKLKADCQTAREYAANYENNPIAEDDSPFLKKPPLKYFVETRRNPKTQKSEKVKIIQKKDGHGGHITKEYEGMLIGRVAILDSAKLGGHDMDALMVLEKYNDGKVLIPWAKAGDWAPSDRIREMEFLLKTPELRPLAFGIEESGQHDIMSILGEKVLRGETQISPDMLHPMSHGGQEKEFRCRMSIEPLLDSDNLYLKDTLPPMVLEQLLLFPQHKWDDYIDCIAFGNLFFQQLGLFGAMPKAAYKPKVPLYAAAGV